MSQMNSKTGALDLDHQDQIGHETLKFYVNGLQSSTILVIYNLHLETLTVP